MKRYLLYLIRWQLSTPILALCLWWMRNVPVWESTILANLIGGAIFFWIDRWIFKEKENSNDNQ